MATTLDISYFNSFYIKSSKNQETWHVEESRIKGGFNEVSVDLGVKAHAVNEDYAEEHRPNAMIYSGIFNSRTGLNETNQFNMALPITKAVDKANGSIQKLYAEETNLLILQEDKVSKALIDKDAIFSAEGGGTVTSSNVVIGQIVPFAGKYGISKDPESFAAYGNRKYFADKNRGVILRLSSGQGGGDGLTPISEFGMRDFFRDKLKQAQRIVGMYDTHHQGYIISLQGNSIMAPEAESTGFYETISFSDPINGWTSRHAFRPFFGFSHENEFYTFQTQNLWRHYSNSRHSSYYGDQIVENSTNVYSKAPEITFFINQNSKDENAFYALDYEGTDSWSVKNIKTNTFNFGGSNETSLDVGKNINGYNLSGNNSETYINASLFYKKGQQYCAAIQNDSMIRKDEIWLGTSVDNLDVTGVKGNYMQMTFYINTDIDDSLGPITNYNSRHELTNVKTYFNPL